MKKILLFLSFLLMSIGVWGAETLYKETIFNSTNNSGSIQSYTSNWYNITNGFRVDIVNGNNNQNNWDYIKFGRKDNASTGTIITNVSIDKKITKVGITIDALTVSNVVSITLYKSTNKSSWTSLGTFSKSTGTQYCTINAGNQSTELYYKLEFVCKSGSSNGLIQISHICFYTEDSSPTYTITAQSNNNSYGTVSLSGNVITGSPKSGYRYASPAYSVSPDNSATVAQNGNEFTVTPSANTTVTINFESIPSHTLSFNTKGIVMFPSKTLREDSIYNIVETINDDLLSDCEYTKFVGWATQSDVVDSDISPTILNNITIGTQDITLYAVFRKGNVNKQQTVLYCDEIHNSFQKHNYDDNEACYEDTVVTWCGKFHKDVADRKWIQIRKNNNTSYIKIVFKERTNVNKVLLTVTSTSNVEGGINDMTTYNPFGTPVSLNLSIADTLGNDNGNVICSDTTNTVDNYQILTLNQTTFECDSFYIITDGTTTNAACRIWGIQLFYDERVNVKYSSIPRCYKTNFDVIEWNNNWIKLNIDSGYGIKSNELDYTLLTDIKQPDSTYKIDIDNLDNISCTKLPIIITNKYSDEYVDSVNVPILIRENSADNSTINNPDSASCDLVILDEGKLTLTDDLENRDVTVYPRGVLNIPTGKTYTVNSLTLRRDNDSVPYLSYKGTLDIKNGMFFEVRTDADDWRWITLPDTFKASEITKSPEISLGYYDGDVRAQNGRGGWKTPQDTMTFKPGDGFIFGIDLDNTEKRIYKYKIDTAVLKTEKQAKQVSVSPYGYNLSPLPPSNDLGWNIVANPFMDAYKLDAVSTIKLGKLVKSDTNPWDGKWVDSLGVDGDLRYIVIRCYDNDPDVIAAGHYRQILLTDGYDLKPYTAFFVQVAEGVRKLVFENSKKVSRAPKLSTNNNNETFLRVNVGNRKTGCFISNRFTDDYEVGDDMESLYPIYQLINGYKLLYSAINDSVIEHGIKIYTPSGTLCLDDAVNVNDFDEINALYNGGWYDLLHGETVDVTGEFILQAKRKTQNIATDLDESNTNTIFDKYIHNGNIYIRKNNCIFTVLGEIIK